MSCELFAYLSYRAGFDVIAQQEIDWSGVKALDCITLLDTKSDYAHVYVRKKQRRNED